ncbi:MAG: ISAs1 family transposase, partial [Bacteroidota bacterium]
MESKPTDNFILDLFTKVPDWRIARCKLHNLSEMLFISLCAMLSGADSFTEIEEYGHDRYDWLSQYLELKNGIPAHDTFRRMFMALSPDSFTSIFQEWMSEVHQLSKGSLINLDGKQLRGTKDLGAGRYGFYLVGAWAAQNGLCLAQQKVGEKTNEITALPEIIKLLDVEGCILSIDAMGTQKVIADQIIEAGGDYLLSVKENQGRLFEEIHDFFTEEAKSEFRFVHLEQDDQWDKGHGRIERRLCSYSTDVQTLSEAPKWKGIKSIIRIEAERIIRDKRERKTRYYISSLETSAQHLNQCIRSHWSIENSLHWVLDMVFNEDRSRIRTDHAPENMALLRKWTLNLIKKNKGKYSVKAARLKAAWNTRILEQLLFGIN